MRPLRELLSLLADRTGSTSAEFAIVAPAALMLMIGGMYVSMLGFTASSLRYAAEQGARCAAVNTTTCNNAAATQAYALGQFRNLSGSSATFVNTVESCGQRVTGSITYEMEVATYSMTIPISASACFP